MALMVWKCVHGVAPAYLSDLCVPATAVSGCHQLRSAATGTLLVPRAWTATGQRRFAVNRPATWNCLPPTLQSPDLSESAFKQALVLDCPALLRRLHDSGAGYKYPDLLTYLLTTQPLCNSRCSCYAIAVFFFISNFVCQWLGWKPDGRSSKKVVRQNAENRGGFWRLIYRLFSIINVICVLCVKLSVLLT